MPHRERNVCFSLSSILSSWFCSTNYHFIQPTYVEETPILPQHSLTSHPALLPSMALTHPMGHVTHSHAPLLTVHLPPLAYKFQETNDWCLFRTRLYPSAQNSA